MSKSRLIEFDNLRNTRDLGGLVGRNGRTIKAGKLISKEEIEPVFLRIDSELADKSKK